MRLLKNVLKMISLFLLSGVVAMKSPSQTVCFLSGSLQMKPFVPMLVHLSS